MAELTVFDRAAHEAVLPPRTLARVRGRAELAAFQERGAVELLDRLPLETREIHALACARSRDRGELPILRSASRLAASAASSAILRMAWAELDRLERVRPRA